MDKKIAISEAELAVMEVLWQSEKPLSAFEIRQALNSSRQSRQWERTTVLTLIRRLVEKDVLIQEKRDIYYYSAGILREEYLKEETSNFLNRLYKGKAKDLIANLFQAESLSKEDVDELRKYIGEDGRYGE